MPLPKYVPRLMSVEPEGFGKVQGIRWHTPGPETRAASINAAKFQHMYVIRIRHRAKEIRQAQREAQARSGDTAAVKVDPLGDLANQLGCSRTRLLACLRGEAIMRLEDIAAADLVLGGGISEFARNAERNTAGPGRRQ